MQESIPSQATNSRRPGLPTNNSEVNLLKGKKQGAANRKSFKGDHQGGDITYMMTQNMPNSHGADNVLAQVGSPTNQNYRPLMHMNLSHGDVSEDSDSDGDELTLNAYDEPTGNWGALTNHDPKTPEVANRPHLYDDAHPVAAWKSSSRVHEANQRSQQARRQGQGKPQDVFFPNGTAGMTTHD